MKYYFCKVQDSKKEKIFAAAAFLTLLEYPKKINDSFKFEALKQGKLSKILNGKRTPDIQFLKNVHEKLGIDGNTLLKLL